MEPTPREIKQYHVFLASPGDVNAEREHVRKFFERYNRLAEGLWRVRFEVVDWENYASIGIGRPQDLIAQQTLEQFSESLALVIGIMGQRFGTPSEEAESGTEEEFNWALQSYLERGFPEIKWFFRKVERLEVPVDPEESLKAVEQWKKVLEFRRRLENSKPPVFYAEYPGPVGFREVLDNDLNRWLSDPDRPWIAEQEENEPVGGALPLTPPAEYYENTQRDFQWLDIAGIDTDRAFKIPLSEIYVRLRVMFDEDAAEETEAYESGPIDIQTALLRYKKLVIVGDPGSGKSTFLKYIALMLAKSFTTGNPGIALEKLYLPEPLPIPIFLSCWDLSDFIKEHKSARLNTLIDFISERLDAYGYQLPADDAEKLLDSGNCCLLFDGLDEVPTEAGRAAISRLLEECVERFTKNRFVVTSRVRAYSGDTILKGEFTRCDIQPFDADDRAEFLRNWVALLFEIPPDRVEQKDTEAEREFSSLANGIEDSARIRPLAVNPLLLTVIAIVHWNRKRLPEQRVDLYDECVDVLLGQRKEAEHILIGRRADILDEEREEQIHEERAWVRKRFAEIALHILEQDGDQDEVTKGDVVKLLVPRFIDQGANTKEQAAIRAERFLERQELRSGLLVSRRAQTYRFAHLTFQEYLAAWQLSNMEFGEVAERIESKLRHSKWFETLQLLGGAWAKESDDKANRYVEWLLEKRGSSIQKKAPIVALCSNIVNDISGVAELKPETRSEFNKALKATLDAFRKGSGIPAKTQLEILEALGQLGAAVKSHLIDATKAALFQVRRRAIEMLLPHLSDDDLFSLIHIFQDGSKEPISSYLKALIERDMKRASRMVLSQKIITEKGGTGILQAIQKSKDEIRMPLLEHIALKCESARVRRNAYRYLAEKWSDDRTHTFLIEQGIKSENSGVREEAYRNLAENWPDDRTHTFLIEQGIKDKNSGVRQEAYRNLAENWPDERTYTLLMEQGIKDENSFVRQEAYRKLAKNWPDERTHILIIEEGIKDKNPWVRQEAYHNLAKYWPDERTHILLIEQGIKDESFLVRRAAYNHLAKNWPDARTRTLLMEQGIKDENSFVRRWASFYLNGIGPGKY